MNIFKFIGALFLFICMSIALIRGYNYWTDGFSTQELVSHHPYNQDFEVKPLDPDRFYDLEQILSQSFRYLGKGCQFYVFESDDGCYVLKLLKNKHLRTLSKLESIPMPQYLKRKIKHYNGRRQEKARALFASCKLAYEQSAQESGLVYVHLNRVPYVHKCICLKDPTGWSHKINLDDYEFVIQRKAQPFTQIISQLAIREDFIEQITPYIDQLTTLILKRCEKGIKDKDRSFVKNVAFTEQGAIFTDVGQWSLDPTVSTKEAQTSDVKKRLGDLEGWVSTHFPLQSKPIKQLIDQKLAAVS